MISFFNISASPFSYTRTGLSLSGPALQQAFSAASRAFVFIHEAFSNISFSLVGLGYRVVKMPFSYVLYIVHGMRQDGPAAIIGNILTYCADIGRFYQFLDALKVIDLEKIGAQMGKTRFIGAMAHISLGSVVNGLTGFASAFFGMDAIIRLSKGNLTRLETIATWIDLAASVMQIAFVILFFAGVVCFPFLLVSSLVPLAFSILTFSLRSIESIRNCRKSAVP
jgi:hypothetical protein